MRTQTSSEAIKQTHKVKVEQNFLFSELGALQVSDAFA